VANDTLPIRRIMMSLVTKGAITIPPSADFERTNSMV
jgi:hypothetical protein